MPTDQELNHAWWEERAARHATTPMYRPWIEALERGEPALYALERELVGSVKGARLLHLPCHIGHDTLSWALLGAEVTGVDFSETALSEAAALSERLGIPAEWVHADATDLPAELHGGFHVVVSTYGAYGWMEDLDAYVAGVARCLAPGGRFVLVDGHPVFYALDGEATERGEVHLNDPLMGGARAVDQRAGSYADPEMPTQHDVSVGWCHGVGELLSAVLRAGLEIVHFAEHDHCVWPGVPGMTQREDGTFILPEALHGRVPCMLSLVARKPEPDASALTSIARNWGQVAESYAARLGDELEGKPFDRDWLDAFAVAVGAHRRVADVGCGPGHITAALRSRRLEVVGFDLAPEMVQVARQRVPEARFEVADLRSLPVPDAHFAGLVCMYTLINIPRAGVVAALRELARVVRPGGVLAIATHAGEGSEHVTDLLGTELPMTATLYTPAELKKAAEQAGWEDLELKVRQAYPTEYPHERIYLTGHAPRD